VLVVVLSEPVELPLQFVQGGSGGLRGEEAFQGLVEAFDLALGLRVAGGTVLLFHAEQGQQVLESIAAAAEACGVDASVVGEG